jgi:hypothetical protein
VSHEHLAKQRQREPLVGGRDEPFVAKRIERLQLGGGQHVGASHRVPLRARQAFPSQRERPQCHVALMRGGALRDVDRQAAPLHRLRPRIDIDEVLQSHAGHAAHCLRSNADEERLVGRGTDALVAGHACERVRCDA